MYYQCLVITWQQESYQVYKHQHHFCSPSRLAIDYFELQLGGLLCYTYHKMNTSNPAKPLHKFVSHIYFADKTIKLWKVTERDRKPEGFNLKDDAGISRDPSSVNTLVVRSKLWNENFVSMLCYCLDDFQKCFLTGYGSNL